MGILDELKRDLVEPVKSFTKEVGDDTVGDAARFYSAQAKKIQENAKRAEQRAAEKRAEARRRQEETKKNRKTLMNRGLIVFAALIVIGVVVLSLILNHGL